MTNKELFLSYNETKDIEIRNRIIEKNLGLVYRIASKYALPLSTDVEDLASIGVIKMIQSIDRYDISKGYAFSTFISRVLHNEYLQMLRNKKRRVSVEEPLHYMSNITDEDDKSFEEFLPASVENIDETVFYNKFMERFNFALTEEERKIINLLDSDVKVKDIVKILGISKRSYYNKLDRIQNKYMNVLKYGRY